MDEIIQTTEKHYKFVNTPMINKSVRKIPGIGLNYGGALISKGFPKAHQVYGQFLILDMKSDRFMVWLQNVCGARDYYAWACYNALHCYSMNHL